MQSKSPAAGAKFIPAVEWTLEQLAENPELGGRCATRRLTLKGLRVWQVQGFKNYLVFYRFTDEELEVVPVRHGATNWVKDFQSENPA